jgi:hypothetical protein
MTIISRDARLSTFTVSNRMQRQKGDDTKKLVSLTSRHRFAVYGHNIFLARYLKIKNSIFI